MNPKIIMIFLSILTLKPLYAHPHIFIDYSVDLNKNSRANIVWTFDPLESERNIYYFDNNSDGTLDTEEVKILYNEGFKRIREYNYFILLRLNDKEIPISKVYNFDARIIEDGRLAYMFDIDIPEISDNDKLSIALFDTTYFVSFGEPDKNSIILDNNYYSLIIKNMSKPYYYDPAAGRNTVLDTSKPKPGWLKVYPTEIFISKQPILNSFGTYKVTLKERLIQLQRVVYLKLSNYMVNIKDGSNKRTLFFILALSFLYGVIHALGPGHRKVVISSYLLSHKSGLPKALSLSFLSAFIHSGSGVFIVIILNSIYLKIKDDIIQDISSLLENTGYYSLLLLSLILIILKVLASRKRQVKKNGIDKIGLSMIILTSLIPCPGAVTIMLFSLTMNMLVTGIFVVLAMSFGIGLSLSLISAIVIKGREIMNLLPKKKLAISQRIIEWTSLGLLLLFALFMIVSR